MSPAIYTGMTLPLFAAVRQEFPRPRETDITGAVRVQLSRLGLEALGGRRVGITAGSRGIRDIGEIVAAAVRWLKDRGAVPVIIAAMGSHGGATAEGQRKLLTHLAITEDSVGAPVLTDMDVVGLGRTPDGLVAYCDRNAAACDGLLIVNRVKPHTAFAEPFGSGLLKMLAVGLGKVPGAAQIHRQGPAQMPQAIEAIAGLLVAGGKVLGGLAIIENAYDETAEMVAVRPEEMVAQERVLFGRARAMMPRLPVEDLDVLIVDEVGKNFSGTGMDVNIIGRWRLPGVPEPASPRIRRIVALRLSPESEGNAQGIGLADVVTRRLVDAIDPGTTYTNIITSTYVQRGFIPITMPTDREAVAAALASLALPDPERARMMRIRNTLHLDELWVSEPVLQEVVGRPGVSSGPLEPLRFTEDGRIAGVS